MKIQVKNIRSIKKASMDFTGIARVFGPNRSGKTSLRNAIAACLLGETAIYGATAKKVDGVRSEGAKVGSVKIQDGDSWSRSVLWPGGAGEHISAPMGDTVTMGWVDPPSAFDRQAWSRFVTLLAGVSPPEEWDEVEKVIRPRLPIEPDEDLGDVQELFDQGEWDGTAKEAETNASNARRSWERITGVRFGSSKADGWEAEGYNDTVNDKAWRSMIGQLEEELKKSQVQEGVEGVQREALVDQIHVTREALVKRQKAVENHMRVAGELEEEDKLYPATEPKTCPHCNCEIVVNRDGDVVKLDPEMNDRRSDEYKVLQEKLDKIGDALVKQQADLSAKKLILQDLDQQLMTFDSRDEKLRQVAEIAQQLRDKKQELAAFHLTEDARQEFEDWRFWTAVAEFFNDAGYRLELVQSSLEKLQSEIDTLATALFPGVEVKISWGKKGVELTYDGVSYENMTWPSDPNSTALLTQVMFQMLAADRYGQDSIILIDRFDTMEAPQRGRVLKLLVVMKRPAVVFETPTPLERPEVDKLAAKGYGRSFWIDNGDVVPVGDG